MRRTVVLLAAVVLAVPAVPAGAAVAVAPPAGDSGLATTARPPFDVGNGPEIRTRLFASTTGNVKCRRLASGSQEWLSAC